MNIQKFTVCSSVFLLYSILVSPTVLAQNTSQASSSDGIISSYDVNAPAWLLRNWGRQAREERRLDEAFFLLSRSLESDPGNPETLTELALSHFASADILQAQVYLNRALENRSRLSSSDLEYFILYQLAEIFEHSDIRNYERILLEIVSYDTDFSSNEAIALNLRRNIQRVINSQQRSEQRNLDRAIELYRINDSFSLRAHIALGRFYVHSGRYNEAQEHLLFAVIKMYTKIISRLRESDPYFTFSTTEEFFTAIEERPAYISYLQNSTFDEALFYLGAASFGFNPSAQYVYTGLWEVLLLLPYDSPFANLAQSRIQNPVREPILYGSEQFLEEVN